MRVLGDARIITPGGVRHGWIGVADGRIARIADGVAPEEGYGLRGRWVVPGFVDLHTHGGAGGSYPSGDLEQARRAFAFHLAHGTTTALASLVTGPLDDLVDATGALAELCDEGLFAGIHWEGPYLSAARCGAQDPRSLRRPDSAEFARLVKAARGHGRMITIAPELPGAIDLIAESVAEGVIAALGHTDCSYEEFVAGADAGGTVATHLFNGMRPLHHRDPGPIGAALNDERITVELINDGVHLHPGIVRMALKAVGAGRAALITDAMAAAGLGDGSYRLGAMTVDVDGGVARLAEGGALAGSTLTMDVAFKRAVRLAGLSMADAVAVTSSTPARVLGLDHRIGSLEEGKDADLVVLSEELTVVGVMRRGEWIIDPPK
ncbi:N-acetylglucosamine-6-phosphate deacetylase [Rhizohabitans arisaemae]|uniref:N-acetylglucosamine-6-phosphate deacetylase n=1 Tax=Rhizohabitans arisaemae TaxID=2720610 RepID=UPI0024B203A7|nr:N-acetylglucosamine-6-phosphate deacetylase [Rhizohabitans arisaemae]